MIRRSYLRWYLWLHDVCPEHGNMTPAFPSGAFCVPCCERDKNKFERRVERYRRELKGYYCEKCGELRR